MQALCEKVLSVCRRFPDQSLSGEDIRGQTGARNLSDVAEALTQLVNRNKLRCLVKGPQLLEYQYVPDEEQQKLSKLSKDELLVYRSIAEGGDRGVWIKDLRAATGLQPTPLRRILNTLESRGIIKAINSIEKKNRLVYMLANLEPNREITGGPWYSDQEFDEEFVKQLQDHIKGMVERQGSADVHAIEGWLSESGICKVQLTGEEIQSLVNAMVYDGDLEEVIDPTAASGSLFYAGEVRYQSAAPPVFNPMQEIPCTDCPVARLCHEGGEVCPEKCVYLEQWMELDFD